MAAIEKDMHYESGFTLLEVLVVITLIALLAGLVTFSVSGNENRRLQTESERLQQVLQAVSDEAVLQGSEMGVILTEDNYSFVSYDYPSHSWRLFSDSVFKRYTLPDGIRMMLTLDKPVALDTPKRSRRLSPALFFSPGGEMTPFRLSLSSQSSHGRTELVSDGLSPIALHSREAP